MKALSLVLFSAVISFSTFAREWENPCRNNKNLHADLVAVTGKQGAEMVTLKLRNSQTIRVPLAKLTKADRTYVAEARKTLPPAPAAEEAAGTTKSRK